MKKAFLFAFLVAAAAWGQICTTPVYPSSVAVDSQLHWSVDNVQTVLTADIGTSDTGFVVLSSTGLVNNSVITVGNPVPGVNGIGSGYEKMLVTGGLGNLLSVTRGYANTTAITHHSGELVSGYTDACSFNQMRAEIKAIETTLGHDLVNIPAGGANPGGSDGNIQYKSGGSLGGLNTNSQVQYYKNAKAPTAVGGCGLAMDGTTDDSTALNTCIVTLSSGNGGIIQFPPGVVALSHANGGIGALISFDKIHLRGSGGYTNSTLSYESPGPPVATISYGKTIFRAIGSWSNGEPLVEFNGIVNSKSFIAGGGLEDIDLDCAGLCSKALKISGFDGMVFRNLHIHDFTSAAAAGDYGVELPSNNGSPATGTCGNSGGTSLFENVDIQSYRTGAAGLKLGTNDSTYDVCSNRFVHLTIQASNRPGLHGLLLAHSDSNQFANSAFQNFGDAATITNIVATSATAATVFAPGHGMQAGVSNDGVYIRGTCTVAFTSGACTGGADVPGLDGAFSGTYVDADHISITGAYGLTNGVTYFGTLITGADVEAQAGGGNDNMFTNTLVCQGIHNSDTTSPYLLFIGYNWRECIGGNNNFKRISGTGFASIGVDGSFWKLRPQNQIDFEGPGGAARGLNFKAGSLVPFGVAIHTADAVSSSLTYSMLMGITQWIGSVPSSGSGQTPLLGLDSNDVINLGISSNTNQINANGPFRPKQYTVSTLPATPAAGLIVYVSNGTPGSSPCTASGTGAFAVSAGSQWNCFTNSGSGSGTVNVIASGATAMGTAAIGSGACATTVTVGASGVATSDPIQISPASNLNSVTGYSPSVNGGLALTWYPTSNNVNFAVCNWSNASITPGAVTINWKVMR